MAKKKKIKKKVVKKKRCSVCGKLGHNARTCALGDWRP
jgi:hypothetical protein